MEPFREVNLVQTERIRYHLVQTPEGFDLIHEMIFPLSKADLHSIIFFLEKVKAEQHLPHEYMHGNLFFSYSPEESSNEVTIQYEDRRMCMDLTIALQFLGGLKDRGGDL